MAQWPTLRLTQIEWETINALKSQRVNERIPGFIAKVDNVRSLFENIKTRFKRFITKNTNARGRLDMQAITVAKRRTEFSRQWVTLRAKMGSTVQPLHKASVSRNGPDISINA